MSIEKGKFQRLTARKRLEIRLHVAMCKPCREYNRDSKKLDSLLKVRFNQRQKYRFSEAEKKTIKKRLSA